MGNTSSNVAPVEGVKQDKHKCEGDSCKLENKGAVKPQPAGGDETKKLKPCCACPETKKARDTCIIERGEENCKDLIEAHKECMRKLGFNV